MGSESNHPDRAPETLEVTEPPSAFVPDEEEFGARGFGREYRIDGRTGRPFRVAFAAGFAYVSAAWNIFILATLNYVAGGLESWFVAISLLLICLLVWGSVAARNGRSGRILVVTASALIIVHVADIVYYLAEDGTFAPATLFSFVAPTVVLFCLLHARSRAWFRLKGGKTF